MITFQQMPVEVREKYQFKQQEKDIMGIDLAGKVELITRIENEKKSVMSDFKKRIDEANGEKNRLSSNINLGYEYRSYTCRIHRDFEKKEKRYVCVHSGDVIQTRKFEPQDFQQQFEDTEDVNKETNTGKDISPTLGQGVIVKTQEELKKEKQAALEKEATSILKKSGIKKNCQKSKAKK